MPRISWDSPGARRYESGVDRGVLYLPDRTGVPWNGLVSVDEVRVDSEVESFYFDGRKYLDVKSPGEYSAVLKALTYPDEFLVFDGYDEVAPGLFLDDQPLKDTFSLSYRTLVGNDTEGASAGQKIHIAYNLTAKADNVGRSTSADSASPTELSWTLTGVPEDIVGFRPTSHVVVNTSNMSVDLIAELENVLYGTQDAINVPKSSTLPTIPELKALVGEYII